MIEVYYNPVTLLPEAEAINPASTVMGGISGELIAKKFMSARDSSGFMPVSTYPTKPTNAAMVAFAAASNKTFCDIYWNETNDAEVPFIKAVKIKDDGTLDSVIELAGVNPAPVITPADLDPLSPNYTAARSITPQAWSALTVETTLYDEFPVDDDEDYSRVLDKYDLGLPNNAAGVFSGQSHTIKGYNSTALSTYGSNLFQRDVATISGQPRKTIKMTVPDSGASTSGYGTVNATKPRTELLSRHGTLSSGRFATTDDFMQRMKLRVVQAPVGQEFAVSQLHSNTRPLCIISVDQDPMVLEAAIRRVENGASTTYTIKPSLALNEWVEIILSHRGGSPNHFLDIYVNGVLAATDNTNPLTQAQPLFMKAGVYNVGATGTKDEAKNVIVEFVVDELEPNEVGVFPYVYEAGKARPSAVIDLSIFGISASSIITQWTLPAANGSALAGGVLQRSLDGETWTQIATVSAVAVNYENTGLFENTQHFYRIAFTNAKGQAKFSNVVRAITLANLSSRALVSVATPFSFNLPWGKSFKRYNVTIPAIGVVPTDDISLSMGEYVSSSFEDNSRETLDINNMMAVSGTDSFNVTINFLVSTMGKINLIWRKK
jgi:hypothetical protein